MSQSTLAGPSLETVIYEKKGAIAYVTVNRPKVLNALNHRTWADLRTAFEEARDDAEVRGVILTGSGDKAFIAGARHQRTRPGHCRRRRTIQQLRTRRPESYRESRQAGDRCNQWLRARWWLRNRNGLHHQNRCRERKVRPARSEVGPSSRWRRHAALAQAGGQRPGSSAYSLRRDD